MSKFEASGHASRVYKGVFWSAVNALYVNAAGFAVFVILSHLLAPEDFGLSAVSGAAVAFFAMALPTGFGEALVQRKILTDAHKDSAFWLSLGFGGLCTGAAVLCAHLVATIYGKPALDIVMPALASRILFDALGIVPNSIIARTMNFRLLVMRTAVTTLAAGVLGVALALEGQGVWALIVSQVATAALSTGVVFLASGYRPRSLGSFEALRDLSRYGLFATGTRGVQFLSGQADQLLVGLFLGTEAVGLYAFAKRVFTIAIDLTSGVLTAVAHPAFSNAQGDTVLVRRGFIRATSFVSLVAFPLFTGLAATAPTLVPAIFGAKWQGAAIPLSLLCVLGIITCIGTIQAALITSFGKASWWFGYQLLAGVSNLAVYVVAAPYGLRTMIGAFIIKTYLLWPVPVAMAVRLLGIGLTEYMRPLLPPLAASSALYAVVVYVDSACGAAAPLMRLSAEIPAGALAYVGALALLAPGSLRTFVRSLSRVRQVHHA